MHPGAACPNKSTILIILLNANEHIGQLGCVSIMINSALAAQNAVYHNFDNLAATCGCFTNISDRPLSMTQALRSVASNDGYARSYIGWSDVRNIFAHVARWRCKMSDSRAWEKVVRRSVT